MARTITELGRGGQRCAERDLGWHRGPIRTGTHALERGFRCLEAFSARGRKRAEDSLPTLLGDIRALVESQSQADPPLRTTRLSTRLRAAEVRRQRLAQKGYGDDEALPTVQTITTTRNTLGYFPTKVAKTPPPKTFHTPRRSSSTCIGPIRPPRP